MQYIILVIFLGLAIFSLWEWIFSKWIKAQRTKIIAALAAAIITTPLLIVGLFFLIFYSPDRDFNRQGWMANEERRYEYSKDIVQSKMLIGKSQPEVREILGVAFEKTGNDWDYVLGYRPDNMVSKSPGHLWVKFKNDTVVDVTDY